MSHARILAVLFSGLLMFSAACAVTPVEPAHIYIVRHAEKLAGDDPALSEAGKARARALAGLLAERGVTRIFSTDTLRTRSTAAPLAARLGVPVEIYDHKTPVELAEQVRDSGESVLIVGHSNTIAGLAAAFGADAGPEVRDDEYDRLYDIALAEPVRVDIRCY
ncbi:MAG: histidine phosphatase family protein [Proteobacteria bacterium]|nr:histidine phosphatase family protein [Pseudomonadota bacterium]